MPMKVCSEPSCTRLVDQAHPCPIHAPKPWQGQLRNGRHGRMKSGSREQKINRAIKMRDGMRCYICGQVRLERDLEVDHVIPLEAAAAPDGIAGPDTWSNRRPACRNPCHADKSARERELARRRAREAA